MKRRIIQALSCAVISVGLFLEPLQTEASRHYEFNTLYEIEVTAYCDLGETSTGYVLTPETKRKVAAFSPEYYGCTACVYYDDELVGIYEVLDTGSERIHQGEVLDLFMPEGEEVCKQWGRKKCQVYFMKGVG